MRNNTGRVGGNLSPSITMLTPPNTHLEWGFNPSANINTHVARGFRSNTNQSPNHYNNKFTTHVHKWPYLESVFIETKIISYKLGVSTYVISSICLSWFGNSVDLIYQLRKLYLKQMKLTWKTKSFIIIILINIFYFRTLILKSTSYLTT